METTKFWLVRHGETEWNAGRRLQGWLDIPLSPRGERQAELLGAHLRSLRDPVFDAVISSDLARAATTAHIATKHLGKPVTTDERLRERNYGVYQGMDWAALTEGLSDQKIDLRDPTQTIQDGESFQEFAQRIVAAFEDIARAHPGKHVLAFAHGGVIDIAWRKAGGHALTVKRDGTILNASINIFEIATDGGWHTGEWNLVGHLDTPALDDVMHT